MPQRKNRSCLRFDVFGQDRRTDPPPEACYLCPPAGRNIQAGHRYALLGSGSGFARQQFDSFDSSASILLFSSEIDVVGIDEAQFFDDGLVNVCNELADRGVRVIIAGLDMDFKGVPFGPMPALCAIADEVTKVHAICVKCGDLAYVSHRTVANDKRVLLGEKEEYEPLCRCCYRKAVEEEKTAQASHS